MREQSALKRIAEERHGIAISRIKRMCHCGDEYGPVDQDLDGNYVFDSRCSKCAHKENLARAMKWNALSQEERDKTVFIQVRRHCNHCYENQPLNGMAWCLHCAVRYTDGLRGTEPDDVLNARIKYFQSLAQTTRKAV